MIPLPCIDSVWISLAVSRDYVPRASVVMTLAVVTGSLLLLVPYFAHVFDFLDPEKVIINIDKFGNTTAATIPLALNDALCSGRLKKGDLVLLASVGAGFTVGAVLLRWGI